jgi:pimeloyl-ACP methyl ester carboxylesterase
VTRRQSRGVLHWFGRILLGIVVLTVVLLAAGVIAQWFASAADRRAYPPPGELIDVGGHRLHLVCLGEGSPTVILDALGDGTSAQWGWVQPKVAAATRVCAYDRAGRGWSEAGPTPRDGETIAQELHTLLANAEIEGPKVFVGHSYGALIARIYTDLYPEDVAGMVLVDAGLPELRTDRMPAEVLAHNASDLEFMKIAPWLARLGIFRLIGSGSTLPEPQRSYSQMFYASNALWDSLLEEAQALSLTDAEVGTSGSLGDRPLLILAATRGWVDPNAATDEARRVYNALQQELLSLSTNSVFREVEGASHASLVMEEAYATQVSAGIVEVVEAVRAGSRLVP